jgi:tryptophan synthase alpha chain
VTYITAGDPDLDHSEAVLMALDRAGADILEIGIPFSDPLADGPVIQEAADRALASGTSLATALDRIATIRPHVTAPIVVFTYVNPILRMGLERFAAEISRAGVDGVLVLDLPLEEAGPFHDMMRGVGVDVIFLVSPTTSDRRLERAAALGSGFLYAISRMGVTGESPRLSDSARALVARIRRVTALPVALGFGISRPEHVTEAGAFADAVVVGSGLVKVVAQTGRSPHLGTRVAEYVQWLKGEVKAPSV